MEEVTLDNGHGAPSRWSPPKGEVQKRSLQSDPHQSYLLYVPTSGGQDAPVLVSVHGLARNAQEQSHVFASYCEAAGAVLLAPLFTRDLHSDYQRLGRLGRGIRADLALDRCIAETASLTGADATRIYLFGFSGGAQFAHRYTLAHPHRVASAVVAASGWYTFPDTRVAYPYGIRQSRKLPGVYFNPEEFLRVPIAVLVGENDLTDANLRKTARVNEQQGVNRVERARKWVATMQAAADAYRMPSRVTYAEVPGIDHSFGQFCERGRLAERVFEALFGMPIETLHAQPAETPAPSSARPLPLGVIPAVEPDEREAI